MKIRPAPRAVPTRPNYLRVNLPTRPRAHQDHVLRVPHTTVAGRLASLLVDVHVRMEEAKAVREAQKTLAAASVSLEVASAAVGVCWFHPTLELEESWRDWDDLRDYGAQVMEDLAEGVPKLGMAKAARVEWARANDQVEKAQGQINDLRALLAELEDPNAPDPEDLDAHQTILQETLASLESADLDHVEALSSRLDVAEEFYLVPPYDHTEIAALFAVLVQPIMDLVIPPKEVDDRADF